jgi:hypothetical protein
VSHGDVGHRQRYKATAAEGVPESGAPLLHKPFKTGELARVINEVLEGGQDRHILCA